MGSERNQSAIAGPRNACHGNEKNRMTRLRYKSKLRNRHFRLMLGRLFPHCSPDGLELPRLERQKQQALAEDVDVLSKPSTEQLVQDAAWRK